jgi:protein-S-isoprenylcysteine O-methyltransferase Ste14
MNSFNSLNPWLIPSPRSVHRRLPVVDRVFIPFEEAKMLCQFGETYASYTRRVRRWI